MGQCREVQIGYIALEIPRNCKHCPYYKNGNCYVTGVNSQRSSGMYGAFYNRPKWCPIVEIPEKDLKPGDSGIDGWRAIGWNDAVEKLKKHRLILRRR